MSDNYSLPIDGCCLDCKGYGFLPQRRTALLFGNVKFRLVLRQGIAASRLMANFCFYTLENQVVLPISGSSLQRLKWPSAWLSVTAWGDGT
jgi:hypothetical protein